MKNLKQLIEAKLKEFDEFMLDEYGQWKIGRIEAKAFLEEALTDIAQETAERLKLEKVVKEVECIGNMHDSYNQAVSELETKKHKFFNE